MRRITIPCNVEKKDGNPVYGILKIEQSYNNFYIKHHSIRYAVMIIAEHVSQYNMNTLQNDIEKYDCALERRM